MNGIGDQRRDEQFEGLLNGFHDLVTSRSRSSFLIAAGEVVRSIEMGVEGG